MSSFGNYSSTTEDYNTKGLSSLELSNNEMNKKLTSSSSYANSTHLRQDPAESSSAPTKPSSSIPRTEKYSRSSSAPNAKVDGDSVIIEEKRKKANGDGYTIHRYIRGKLLGKGGFAKVYLCTALDTNKTYAIKIVPKTNLVKARARQKVNSHDTFIYITYFFSTYFTNAFPLFFGLATIASSRNQNSPDIEAPTRV
jgi:hypothetical protein